MKVGRQHVVSALFLLASCEQTVAANNSNSVDNLSNFAYKAALGNYVYGTTGSGKEYKLDLTDYHGVDGETFVCLLEIESQEGTRLKA